MEGGIDHPTAQAVLEMKDDSSGGLRRVRPAIGVQGPKSEVRIFVHITSIFSAQREVSSQGIISTCSVQEGPPGLSARAGSESAAVAGGIKDQTAAPSECVSADLSNGQRKVHHYIPSYCVHVSLDSRFSEATEIFLRISVETIVPFGGYPTVDMITVSQQESAGVRGGPRDSLAAGIPCKKARAFETDLRAVFLSRSAEC